MSRHDELAQPPSYEDAMRGHDSYAGASAPFLPSPEKESRSHTGQLPMGSGLAPLSLPPAPMPTGQMLPTQQSGSGQQPPVPMFVMPTTTVYVAPPLGPKPTNMVCPVCSKQIRTTTTVTNTGTAHAICILMCLFCCWCCSCLPYCLSGFKITKHECPSCKSYLGSFKP